MRLSSTGRYEDAATELERAIRISPGSPAAHTNLAAQHFRLGRFEKSASESARAIQIVGPNPLDLCNLANAQTQLHRFEEAEESARAALRLNTGFVRANLILGAILVNAPAKRGESIQHLEKAAAEFAPASQFLEATASLALRIEVANDCVGIQYSARAELRQETSARAAADLSDSAPPVSDGGATVVD